MKAKKTIRKLPKISRKLAHFQREMYNMQKRLTTMISEVTEAEKKLAVYELLDAEAESACRPGQVELGAESPGSPSHGGAGDRQKEGSDCRLPDKSDRWLP
jgi:hypothetical protein